MAADWCGTAAFELAWAVPCSGSAMTGVPPSAAGFTGVAVAALSPVLIGAGAGADAASPDLVAADLAWSPALAPTSAPFAGDALARVDPRKAQVVELRFFAGLDVDETAAVLKVSPQTVHCDWKLSKTWLAREMAHKSGA